MNKELILNGEAEVPAIADDTLLAIAEMAEKRIEAVNKIKKMCLKVTNKHDWINQQGKPYLQVSGAEKIARLFGLSWRIDEPLREDEEGGHYGYTYKGYFSMGTVTIEAIGTRSSKDGFFKKYEKDSNGKRTGVELPPSEIDKSDVKKSAYTNCIGNGITRLLGIRNLTWEELQESGISVEGVARVEYRQAEEGKETKDLREEIRHMILEMTEGNQAKAKTMLIHFTSFKGKDGKDVKGKATINELTEKQIPPTYGKVKEAYEIWHKDNEKPVSSAILDFQSAIATATSIEELDNLIGQVVKAGIKGEEYTKLIRFRDLRATEIKEGQ